MKKIVLLACFLLCMTCLLCACGKNKEGTDGLTFEKIDSKTCRVTGIKDKSVTSIVVPAKNGKRTVVAVSDNAFAGMSLTSVELPDGVKTIGAGAFDGCTSLRSLTVGGKSLFKVDGAITGADISFGENALRGVPLMNIKFADSHDGDTSVALTVENPDPNVATVEITAALNSVTDMTKTTSFAPSAAPETVDLGTYGIFRNIRVGAKKSGSDASFSLTAREVQVTASEYNIAYLNASYPVLVYSLKLKEITAEGTIPTFTFLERGAQYDWDHLTYGIQPFPYLTRAAATTNSDFHGARAGCAAWIADLYAADPTSHFHIYVVDNYNELLVQFLYANNIPADNWNAVLLSDGTGTAGYLVNAYNVENPAGKAATMATEWAAVKTDAAANGYSAAKLHTLCTAEREADDSILATYAYVIANAESNVTWWVNRLRTGENLSAITARDADFAAAICAVPSSFYTNSLLAALSEDEQAAFKSMYHFSDTMFADARDSGKKIMVILGTSNAGEGDNFYSYMKLTMTFYGDEYAYYYKGHPGWPTSGCAARQQAEQRLAAEGLTVYELDNAIAAEVILFYNPDVYLSGWQSTTFESVASQEMACLIYDSPVANVNAVYRDKVDMAARRLDAGTANYEGIALDGTHSYFLVEYNNTAEYENQTANYAKHEIAIYDETADVIHYYKLTQGVYAEVNADGQAVA